MLLERVAGIYAREPAPEEPAIPAPPRESPLVLSAVELATKLRSRELRSADLVEEVIARVAKYNPQVNAIVRDRFEAARHEAKRADKILDAMHAADDVGPTEGKGSEDGAQRSAPSRDAAELCAELRARARTFQGWWEDTDECLDAFLALYRASGPPPFLGVPMTVKEAFSLTGMPSVSGHIPTRELRSAATRAAGKRGQGIGSGGGSSGSGGDDDSREIDATVVRRMRMQGFIALGVTNTSELCMWYESDNPVYGRTCNPVSLV